MDPPDHPGRHCPEQPDNKAKARFSFGIFKVLLLHFLVVLLAIFVAVLFIGFGAEAADTMQPLPPGDALRTQSTDAKSGDPCTRPMDSAKSRLFYGIHKSFLVESTNGETG